MIKKIAVLLNYSLIYEFKVYSSTLKIEAVLSSETLVNLYHNIQRHISEYHIAKKRRL